MLSPTPLDYGIYRTAGAWSGNYQQLKLSWQTGIVIDGGSAYGLSGTVIQPGAGNVGIGITAPVAKLDLQGGDYRQEGLTTHVKTFSAGGSPQTFNIARQYHDIVNWGAGGLLVEEFVSYYDHSTIDYGMYMAKWGYSGGLSINTKIAGAVVPAWGAQVYTGVGNNYYRDLQITVPAYYQITVRVTTGMPVTTNAGNTTQNLVYFYP